MRELESTPSSAETKMAMAALIKLQRDYDKLKDATENLTKESQLINVIAGSSNSQASSNGPNFTRTGGPLSSSSSSGNANTPFVFDLPTQGDSSTFSYGGQQQKQVTILRDQDIDALIREERERDIKKVHSDMILVNDMFQ